MKGKQAGQNAKTNVQEGIDENLKVGIEVVVGQGDEVKGVEARVVVYRQQARKE